MWHPRRVGCGSLPQPRAAGPRSFDGDVGRAPNTNDSADPTPGAPLATTVIDSRPHYRRAGRCPCTHLTNGKTDSGELTCSGSQSEETALLACSLRTKWTFSKCPLLQAGLSGLKNLVWGFLGVGAHPFLTFPEHLAVFKTPFAGRRSSEP